MIPFSITKYRLECTNHLLKNKALRNILLLLFAVRLEFTAAKDLPHRPLVKANTNKSWRIATVFRTGGARADYRQGYV